jgi:hypothetical protein
MYFVLHTSMSLKTPSKALTKQVLTSGGRGLCNFVCHCSCNGNGRAAAVATYTYTCSNVSEWQKWGSGINYMTPMTQVYTCTYTRS